MATTVINESDSQDATAFMQELRMAWVLEKPSLLYACKIDIFLT